MYLSLDATRIVRTVSLLEKRIRERFPDAHLGDVGAELHGLAQNAVVRVQEIRKRNVALQGGVWLLVAGVLIPSAMFTVSLPFGKIQNLQNFIQVVEAGLGAVVFIGAAILFLQSLEARLKRQRALTAIHELRALAHIVDMHQLTKDPEHVLRKGARTPSSPERKMTPFELHRYLDYCSELLSLIGKLGALYVQDFPDSQALNAVDQVESLTVGLSRQIWQKMVVIDRYLEGGGGEPIVAD